MKEFLFGWITKPKVMYTLSDELVSAMELMILVILIFTIIGLALHIWSKVEEKRKNGNSKGVRQCVRKKK